MQIHNKIKKKIFAREYIIKKEKNYIRNDWKINI